MLAKLKSRDVFLISVLLTAAVALLWYFVIFQNTKNSIQVAQSELDTANTQLITAHGAVAQLPRLREQVAALSIKRDELLRELPPTAEIGDVVGEIRANVMAAGGTLTSVAQGSTAQNASLPAGVTPITLSLAVDGPFESQFKVLRSLESMSRFSTINALSLTLPGAATSTDPKLASTLGVTVYTFDPNAASASATTGTSTSATSGAPAPAAPAAPAGGTR